MKGFWAATLILVCVVGGCIGTGKSGPTFGKAINLSSDVSPGANRGILTGEASIDALHGIAFAVTSTADNSIDRELLQSVAEELRSSKPTLTKWVSTGEGEWVFYIAHNLDEPEVTFAFTPMDRVTVNDAEHAKPIQLAPGAHGFHVKHSVAAVSVEHVWMPLEGNAARAAFTETEP
jgi:hypothetical protein